MSKFSRGHFQQRMFGKHSGRVQQSGQHLLKESSFYSQNALYTKRPYFQFVPSNKLVLNTYYVPELCFLAFFPLAIYIGTQVHFEVQIPVYDNNTPIMLSEVQIPFVVTRGPWNFRAKIQSLQKFTYYRELKLKSNLQGRNEKHMTTQSLEWYFWSCRRRWLTC